MWPNKERVGHAYAWLWPPRLSAALKVFATACTGAKYSSASYTGVCSWFNAKPVSLQVIIAGQRRQSATYKITTCIYDTCKIADTVSEEFAARAPFSTHLLTRVSFRIEQCMACRF